jgi:hypothetical protein
MFSAISISNSPNKALYPAKNAAPLQQMSLNVTDINNK